MDTIQDYKAFVREYLDGVSINNIIDNCKRVKNTTFSDDLDECGSALLDWAGSLEEIMTYNGGHEKTLAKYPRFDEAWNGVDNLRDEIAERLNPTPYFDEDYYE